LVNSRSNKSGKYPVNEDQVENVAQPVIPARCESIEPGNLGMPRDAIAPEFTLRLVRNDAVWR
jgi:hypothetical protein